MSDRVLPYGRQSIDEEDIRAVVEQLKGDWLTQGPTVKRFEDALASICGAKYVVAVANGTAALHLAALAAGVGPGDRALSPDITFVATSNCIRYAGGTPALVDVDPDTALVSLGALETAAKSGAPPKVILPVSFAGAPANLPAVKKLAERYGARVIEDAAHSLGATYEVDGAIHRSASCSHSDMAILSFHPVKHLTTGEGGAITTNDPKLYERLNDLRTHGITKDAARLQANDGPWYYEQVELGFNYRITDLQCALGVSQAARFPSFLARRREIADRYDAAFAGLSDRVRPLAVPRGVVSAYHLYVLRLVPRANETNASVAERRKTLFMRLRERGIYAQVHYIPIHRQPDYARAGLASGSFAGAETYYAGCISLPMFPAMTDADVDRVVDEIRAAVSA